MKENELFLLIENLTLKLGSLILFNEFSIEVKKNKRIGISGPSGCGKSTFLKSIIHQKFPPNSTFDKFFLPQNFEELKIGYIPQTNGLLPWYSLKRNLELFTSDKIHIDEIVDSTELSGSLNIFPNDLSGGEYQRALLACSLLLKPLFFIADEPLTEIDFMRKWKLLKLWSSKIKEFNSTLIIVSHDIDTLLYLCDEIYLISDKPSNILQKFHIENQQHPRGQETLFNSEMIEIKKQIANLSANNI